MLQANMEKEKHNQFTLSCFHQQLESLKNWREHFIGRSQTAKQRIQKNKRSNVNGDNIYPMVIEMYKENNQGIIKLEDKVDKGFARLDYKIDNLRVEMNQKFAQADNKVDKGFVRLDNKIDNLRVEMDQKFAQADNKVDKGFARLDNKIDNLRVEMNQKFAQADNKIDKGFARLDNKIDNLRVEMDQKFARVDQRLDNMQQQQINQFKWLMGTFITMFGMMATMMGYFII